MPEQRHRQSLTEEAGNTIEEARMVLPGIQAICGFQLVAVFNTRFETALSGDEQCLHLAAFVLVGLAMALIMAPAAYDRQVERGYVTSDFIRLASRLITLSMVPLALGLSLDTYLIARMISHDVAASAGVACGLLTTFIGLWFGLPLLGKRRRRRPSHGSAPLTPPADAR